MNLRHRRGSQRSCILAPHDCAVSTIGPGEALLSRIIEIRGSLRTETAQLVVGSLGLGKVILRIKLSLAKVASTHTRD